MRRSPLLLGKYYWASFKKAKLDVENFHSNRYNENNWKSLFELDSLRMTKSMAYSPWVWQETAMPPVFGKKLLIIGV